MADDMFPLDRVENPHPDMVAMALQYRRMAQADPGQFGLAWLWGLNLMCAAGGWSSADMNAYLDRQDIDLGTIAEARNATPVGISRRGPKAQSREDGLL